MGSLGPVVDRWLTSLDVLNRYPCKSVFVAESTSDERKSLHSDTLLVMMYIFPRQFGLHNPFTSDVDPRQTVQPFKDYTLREEEILKAFPEQKDRPKIPKRLRGLAADLVKKLQIQHNVCPYKRLLVYYCPVCQQYTLVIQLI